MQQHGSKYFAHRTPSPGIWSVGQNSRELKRITNAATWLPADIPSYSPPPPMTLEMGQISTFSEHGHVTYQIKDNHECSNMVANILHKDPRPYGWGQ